MSYNEMDWVKEAIYVQSDMFLDFDYLPQFNPVTQLTEGTPCVYIPLHDTRPLDEIADLMRYAKGYPPFYPFGKMLESECDLNGWYHFHLAFSKVDMYIVCTPCNTDSPDNEKEFEIPLTRRQRIAISNVLDEQCRKTYNMDCAELLQEAEIVTKEDVHHA